MEPEQLKRWIDTLPLDALQACVTLDATITPRLYEGAAEPEEAAHEAPLGSAPTLASAPTLDSAPGLGEVLEGGAGIDAGRVLDLSDALPSLRLISGPAAPVSGLESAPDMRHDLRVLDTLGQGGMGVVYRAEQAALSREVAVKALRPEVIGDVRATDALLREARITGQLEHPNITPVHLLGQTASDAPILVMKRIDGVPWSELIGAPDHPHWAYLDPSQREASSERLVQHLRILARVCDAVAFAHSRGVLHRDIKPDNVMVGRFGEVVLVDWGIATRWEEEADRARSPLVGTVGYMAPEMIGGSGALSPATDVYLLGATLYTLLNGQPPHALTSRDALPELLMAIHEGAPYDWLHPAPEELRELVDAALSHDPSARPPSANVFRARILDYLEHRGSIQLADEADDHLTTLQDALAQDAAGHTLSPEAIQEPLHSGLFCAQMALRQWPENGRALATKRALLTAMIDHELRHQRPEVAQRFAVQLSPPAPDVEARIQDALQGRTRRARLNAYARALAQRSDLSVGREPRERFIAVVMVAVPVALAALVVGDDMVHSSTDLLMVAESLIVIVVVAVFLMRRTLLQTEVNRRLVTGIGAFLVALWANRILGWQNDLAMRVILSTDALLFFLAACLGATLIHKGFVLSALVSLATLALLNVDAVPPVLVFAIGTAISGIAQVWALLRAGREARPAPPLAEPGEG